jgi:hypothetical protein
MRVAGESGLRWLAEARCTALLSFPSPTLSLRLSTDQGQPGRSRAFLGGFASRRWRRGGAGVGNRGSFLFFGCLPVDWSRAPVFLCRNWCIWRAYCAGVDLRWLEPTTGSTRYGISANKASFAHPLIWDALLLLLFLLAYHGGEGRRRSDGDFAGSGWWGLVQHLGAVLGGSYMSFPVSFHGGRGRFCLG